MGYSYLYFSTWTRVLQRLSLIKRGFSVCPALNAGLSYTCNYTPTWTKRRHPILGALMNIGALLRQCRPFSLTESGPIKSRTKQNNGVRVPFSSSARERQCEAFGFMDRPFHVLVTRLKRRFSRLEGGSSDLF